MKTTLVVMLWLALLAFPETGSGKKPETIYGKNKVLKPNEYYLQQMDLWKREVAKNSKDANAWMNYYRASRNAYIKGEEGDAKESKGNQRFQRLQIIVDEMEKNVPDTFEYNFVKWSNGNNDLRLFPYLKKAHDLSPRSPEPMLSLIFYYEIKGDYESRNATIAEYYAMGDYSPGLLNYSYNMLAGLDTNAIIFTEGDKDTEAALLLQRGKGYRPDVQLLNLNLLLMPEYRRHVFKELDIEPLEYDPLGNEKDYEAFHRAIVSHVARNKQRRPVYVAVNVRDDYTTGISANLYLTGLAYAYSTTGIDHIAILKKNVEQRYALDYIKVYFAHDISYGNVLSMNENYIPPFAVLSHHYGRIGDVAQSAYYKALALKVAVGADRMDAFEKYFQAANPDK